MSYRAPQPTVKQAWARLRDDGRKAAPGKGLEIHYRYYTPAGVVAKASAPHGVDHFVSEHEVMAFLRKEGTPTRLRNQLYPPPIRFSLFFSQRPRLTDCLC